MLFKKTFILNCDTNEDARLKNEMNLNINYENFISEEILNNNFSLENILMESKVESEIQENSQISNEINYEWKLEIPAIDLIANISEGTDEKILDKYIGHFEETQKQKGNIGLAAHNRGYKVNYFNKIKDLNIDDEIIYTYQGVSKVYKVVMKTIIKDIDWSFLENTSDNRLTLITCVENQPEYRRCIQALEKYL